MSSSFKSLDLFGSGPHRFFVAAEGLFVAPNSAIFGTPTPGSQSLGELELEVVVVGRLVASTEAGLWALRDAITDEFAHPPVPGKLIDLHGREWDGVSFIRFEPGERTDRGREVSLAYKAVFRRLS